MSERNCVVCHEPFVSATSTNVCSEACRRTRRRQLKNPVVALGAPPSQRLVNQPEDEIRRANLLIILLDVPGRMLSDFERGFISALTMFENDVDAALARLIERVT